MVKVKVKMYMYPLFKKYLFDNLIKVDNYIPNPISEIIIFTEIMIKEVSGVESI